MKKIIVLNRIAERRALVVGFIHHLESEGAITSPGICKSLDWYSPMLSEEQFQKLTLFINTNRPSFRKHWCKAFYWKTKEITNWGYWFRRFEWKYRLQFLHHIAKHGK